MSLYEEVTTENLKKGEKIGIRKKQTEVILAFNEDSIPVQSIAKYTKLSEDQVVQILRKHGRMYISYFLRGNNYG
jgi:hypothetical protein